MGGVSRAPRNTNSGEHDEDQDHEGDEAEQGRTRQGERAAPAKATKKPPGRAGHTGKAKKAKTDEAKAKKISAIDAAAKVLADAGQPMNTKEMIEAMATKGLWNSPKGKTPHATLYAAILRELKVKKADARFKKVERGKFAATGRA